MENDLNDVACIILSGGKGTRLFPLTLHHCKPAVSFGGRYRLIDIPISNSLNSEIRRIFILAQYLTAELNHHISQTYSFDSFHRGSMDFLTPEELPMGEKLWFEGTADSVRKNLNTLLKAPVEYFLILSGDQLYNIQFEEMIRFAKEKDADLTILTHPVDKTVAPRMGLMEIDDQNKIIDFIEKPKEPSMLNEFEMHSQPGRYLGSMGIYIFKRDVLKKLLQEDPREDFGKHLIPTQIKKDNTYAYVYDGYWEDIGTIESFYEANLLLTHTDKGLNTYDRSNPIYSRLSYLPGPKIYDTQITHSIICEGSVIEAKEIAHSIIGTRVQIKKNTTVKNSVIMGNHYYYSPTPEKGIIEPEYIIGKDCVIEKTIIDEHVSIGNHVRLINKKNLKTYDGDGIYIRDGIIVVPSGSNIPDYFVL